MKPELKPFQHIIDILFNRDGWIKLPLFDRQEVKINGETKYTNSLLLLLASCIYTPISDSRGNNGKEVAYRFNDDLQTCRAIAEENTSDALKQLRLSIIGMCDPHYYFSQTSGNTTINEW